jgi:hypothetical protein
MDWVKSSAEAEPSGGGGWRVKIHEEILTGATVQISGSVGWCVAERMTELDFFLCMDAYG